MKISVDLWRFMRPPGIYAAPRLDALLSGEEKERRNRFVNSLLKIRYSWSHAGLRYILSTYYGTLPHEICIKNDRRGKPFVPGHNDIWFNMSHSGDLTAVAVSRAAPCGVDIEALACSGSVESIVAQIATKTEEDWLNRVPKTERHSAICSLWTVKEAASKAIGFGLLIDFRDIKAQAEITAKPYHIAGYYDVAGNGLVRIIPFGEMDAYVGSLALLIKNKEEELPILNTQFLNLEEFII